MVITDFLDPRWVEQYKDYLPTARNLWDRHDLDTSQFGVESSTTRGIPTGGQGLMGPQELYRRWAKEQLALILTDASLPIRRGSAEAFEIWHASLATSLVTHWNCSSAVPLSLAHRFKLVDLFVRWLRIGASSVPQVVRHCEQFGHIPLDRKSLHVISETFGGIGLAGPFSMGDVHSEKAYQFYQSLAREICAQAGGSPLLLDVFCWNHPDADALYNKKKPSRRFTPVPKMDVQAS